MSTVQTDSTPSGIAKTHGADISRYFPIGAIDSGTELHGQMKASELETPQETSVMPRDMG